MKEDYQEKLPVFNFDNDVITISGKSEPFDAKYVWEIFVKQLDVYTETRKKLTINFCLDIFNSSSSLYLSDIFKILNQKRHKVNFTVNWYYFDDDESMQELGEIYKELNTLIEFHLIERK